MCAWICPIRRINIRRWSVVCVCFAKLVAKYPTFNFQYSCCKSRRIWLNYVMFLLMILFLCWFFRQITFEVLMRKSPHTRTSHTHNKYIYDIYSVFTLPDSKLQIQFTICKSNRKCKSDLQTQIKATGQKQRSRRSSFRMLVHFCTISKSEQSNWPNWKEIVESWLVAYIPFYVTFDHCIFANLVFR